MHVAEESSRWQEEPRALDGGGGGDDARITRISILSGLCREYAQVGKQLNYHLSRTNYLQRH